MRAIPIEEAAKEVWIRHATEEGRERGREEGREEGRETEKVEVARSMRADGFPVETIKKYTGLPESKILGL
jgi:predicted transposase/invertase (TIGR01784 family)